MSDYCDECGTHVDGGDACKCGIDDDWDDQFGSEPQDASMSCWDCEQVWPAVMRRQGDVDPRTFAECVAAKAEHEAGCAFAQARMGAAA